MKKATHKPNGEAIAPDLIWVIRNRENQAIVVLNRPMPRTVKKRYRLIGKYKLIKKGGELTCI